MNYRIEVLDPSGLRRAVFDRVPLLEIWENSADEPNLIRGLLPKSIETLGHRFLLRAWIEGRLVCQAWVVLTAPAWGDTCKLILDKYLPFHEIVAFEAERPARPGNRPVARAFVNREVAAIVRELVNAAPGDIHYWVEHYSYPNGAEREFAKFLARKQDDNALETGGITQGQWVGADRIDASAAFAKDGDTIAGLVVDGLAWPDLRLMMIDAEELEHNSRARARHPETAAWTEAQYATSPYARRARAAQARLQHWITTKGIDFIELNPHRDAAGHFDDRVDAFGRHLGMVFGGGECFNAALVEEGLVEVYLYEGGQYLDPALELKDFYSYTGEHAASIASTGIVLGAFDTNARLLEAVAALACAAGNFIFHVDPEGGLHFRPATGVDRTVHFDPLRHSVTLGSSTRDLVNHLVFSGNPIHGAIEKTYARGDSIAAWGLRPRRFECFSLAQAPDADRLAHALLEDLAYPEPCGRITWHRGDPEVRVGQIIEVRGASLRRLDPALEDEWGGAFADRHLGRIRAVQHRIAGPHLETTAWLTAPRRSVRDPLGFITRSQPGATRLFEFRLDESTVGLDLGFHLD
jgi:endonuclease YncB( thermonuclease family)